MKTVSVLGDGVSKPLGGPFLQQVLAVRTEEHAGGTFRARNGFPLFVKLED
jgi:hypothetical protein